MMKNIVLVCTALFLALAATSCKKPEITSPVAYDETDFNVPDAAFTAPAIGLSINRANKVAYVGEEFEIKVSLYNMPESLFASSMELSFPANVRVERIIRNPNYIGSTDSTIGIEYLTPQTVSYGIVIRRGATPHVLAKSVLFKVICKALSTGNPLSIGCTSIDCRVTKKNQAVSPASLNVSLPTASSTLEMSIQDDFGG